MSRSIMIDEILVHVNVPREQPDAETNPIVQTLQQPRFLRQLRTAVRDVFRRYPVLRKARGVIAR